MLWDTPVGTVAPRELDDWVADWDTPTAVVTVVDGHVAHDAGIPSV